MKLINWQQKIYGVDIRNIGTRKIAKPVIAYAKKRANGNEVVSSTNFRVPRLLFPIFTVGATFLARPFVDWELTLHACVTFNFQLNLFYPAPFRRRFSSFNNADTLFGRCICNWFGGSERRCRRELQRAEANYSLDNLLIFYNIGFARTVTLNWLCRADGRWLRSSFRYDCMRRMTYWRCMGDGGRIFQNNIR